MKLGGHHARRKQGLERPGSPGRVQGRRRGCYSFKHRPILVSSTGRAKRTQASVHALVRAVPGFAPEGDAIGNVRTAAPRPSRSGIETELSPRRRDRTRGSAVRPPDRPGTAPQPPCLVNPSLKPSPRSRRPRPAPALCGGRAADELRRAPGARGDDRGRARRTRRRARGPGGPLRQPLGRCHRRHSRRASVRGCLCAIRHRLSCEPAALYLRGQCPGGDAGRRVTGALRRASVLGRRGALA